MDTTASLADWMQAGGDARQVLDPATGLTKYRVTLEPRPGVPFGSCTASWPSERSWRAMQVELARWHEADSEPTIEGTALSVRQRLRAVLGLPRTARVALTPSGTDAVYLVSAILLRRTEHVHHVVVGASELGGGTLAAAAGRAFSDRAPHPVTDPIAGPGEPIPGLAGRCSATPIYLRAPDGERLPFDAVDAEVERVVRAASASGAHVVVHLVAHSKTGLRAPSVDCLAALREELGIDVLVDAAQGRISPRDVGLARDMGFMVLWTGSKFYCGPPFSAALLFPDGLAEDPGPLPGALSAWFASFDLPREWGDARASLQETANPGLLLRWVGALAETEAYHAIPEHRRARVYHTFAGAVLEVLGPSHRIQVDLPRAPVHRLASGLGAYPSVFGFRVRDDRGWLDADRLRRVHALLDMDRSEQDGALAGQFHLGQPVSLGPPGQGAEAVLRVALGARVVTDLAGADDAGGAWLRAQLEAIRRKTDAIVDLGLLEGAP